MTERQAVILKPGPKGSYVKAPPGLPGQKTFRAEPEFVEAIEERALQESLRTGLTVRFSDLVRRGLQMVLDSDLPEYVRGVRLPCALVETAGGGLSCVTCRINGGEAKGSVFCTRLNREVKLGE